MSADKAELVAAHGAYSSLHRLERHEAERVLEWVRKRLDSDERARETAQYREIEPTDWIVAGEVEISSYISRDEAVEYAHDDYTKVLEVIGRAPVRQHFAVSVPTDEGSETRWFDDRAKAEAYLAAMLAEPASGSAEEAAWKERFIARFIEQMRRDGYDADDLPEVAKKHADAAWPMQDDPLEGTPEDAADAEIDAMGDST